MRRVAAKKGARPKKSADEDDVPLWRKAMLAMELLEPDQWEKDALRWTSRRIRGVSNSLTGLLYLMGLFWIAVAALLVAVYFPAARVVLLFLAAAIALLIGILLWVWAARLQHSLSHRAERLEAMAEMSNIERHAHVVRRVKDRKTKAAPE